MEQDLLVEAYEVLLGEAPVDDIGEIRSKHFTTDLPARAKYRIGDKVATKISAPESSSALKKFAPGTVGEIVGMQQNTGAGAGTKYSRSKGVNRYYVRMPDKKIYPISSMHIRPAGDATPPKGAGNITPAAKPVPAPAPVAKTPPAPSAMETVIEAADLGDLIHVLREYVKSLSPEQESAMAEFFMDRLSPKHDVEPSRPASGPRGESPFGPGYRNVPGYRPGNKWQDEQYRAVQSRGW
jgi:ribosomal protein L21E